MQQMNNLECKENFGKVLLKSHYEYTSLNNNDILRVQSDLNGFYPSAYNNHDQLLIVSNKHGLSISFVFKCITQRNVN